MSDQAARPSLPPALVEMVAQLQRDFPETWLDILASVVVVVRGSKNDGVLALGTHGESAGRSPDNAANGSVDTNTVDLLADYLSTSAMLRARPVRS